MGQPTLFQLDAESEPAGIQKIDRPFSLPDTIIPAERLAPIPTGSLKAARSAIGLFANERILCKEKPRNVEAFSCLKCL